jgi:hypothetical protein
MTYSHRDLYSLLTALDLGTSVAEQDQLLQSARIETSVFSDLLADRVDLIPGTKGSGKSALFRIITDFMPSFLLQQKKVIVAHGVKSQGDPVFHVFTEQFEKLTEDDFVSFWCIYLVSLAHEQFIKDPKFSEYIARADEEVKKFKAACEKAGIPEIQAARSLKSILEWCLKTLSSWRPKLNYLLPEGSGKIEIDLFGNLHDYKQSSQKPENTPKYINEIQDSIENILKINNLSLWLMIDKLDEIFPRRSDLERRALRGLLRAVKYFSSERLRVKIFLRDDMLEQIVSGGEGFTALTHITARQADKLRWTEEQILSFIVKRFVANENFIHFAKIDKEKIDASSVNRTECFNIIFPPSVFRGPKQSSTLRWIINRCSDGLGVVTPRDVLDLLTRAKQKRVDTLAGNPEIQSDYLFDSGSIIYGFNELSLKKRDTYLKAEFPHLWPIMEKFSGGKNRIQRRSN